MVIQIKRLLLLLLLLSATTLCRAQCQQQLATWLKNRKIPELTLLANQSHTEEICFETIHDLSTSVLLTNDDIILLQLDTLKGDIAGTRYYIRYTLPLSENYTSVVVVRETEYELTTLLVNYDREGKTRDILTVAYDEIAESWSRKTSTIDHGLIAVNDNFGDGTFTLKYYRIGPDGKFVGGDSESGYEQLRGGYLLCWVIATYPDDSETCCEFRLHEDRKGDSRMIAQGLSPSKTRYIPFYTGMDFDKTFALVTSCGNYCQMFDIYNKENGQRWSDADSRLIEYDTVYDIILSYSYANDSIRLISPNTFTGKCLTAEALVTLETKNKSDSPYWWSGFEIRSVTTDTVDISYLNNSHTIKIAIKDIVKNLFQTNKGIGKYK